MKLNVIGIHNYSYGLYGNNMHTHLLQLRLPYLIPDKPAIHVLHHQLGSPLEIVNNCNHFAYLKPTLLPFTESLNCDMKNSHRLPIFFSKIRRFKYRATILNCFYSTACISSFNCNYIIKSTN